MLESTLVARFPATCNLIHHYITLHEINLNIVMGRIYVILVAAICLCFCYVANAQDAVYLASNPQTARWSYVETDSNGEHRATIYYSVDTVEGDGVNGNVKLHVEEVPVASPNDTIKSFEFYRFKNGELMADFYAGFEYNVFDGKLESLVSKTIQEKYPDLSEEQKKEVAEEIRMVCVWNRLGQRNHLRRER